MPKTVSLNGRVLGSGNPAYLVAELSANHQQDFNVALQLLEAAKDAGADAVKLQTYTADTLTIRSDREFFRVSGTLWEGRNLHDLYSEAFTPWEWQPKLKQAADDMGLGLFSTAFDETSVDFLETMHVPAYKVASFELVHLPLLRKIAATGKPVILSTGMASLAEIHEAVETLKTCGCDDIVLLKCTSVYPAPTEAMNLRTIPHLAETFGLPVGLSDHTLGTTVAVTAVALGACMIEKHFTLSRTVPGPDSAFSLEPAEFKEMVTAVRTAEAALGKITYGGTADESTSRAFRRSLFVVEHLKAGEILTEQNVRCIRPGYGLHPRYLDLVIGRRVARDVARGTPLSWDLVGGPAEGRSGA